MSTERFAKILAAWTITLSLIVGLPLLSSCNVADGPGKAGQFFLTFDSTVSQARRDKMSCSIHAIVKDWEDYFKIKSRGGWLELRDGDFFLAQRVVNGLTIQVPVQEDFFMGSNFATTVTGTSDELPLVWHLLCHMNLVGDNPLAADAADMTHTHRDWPSWIGLSYNAGWYYLNWWCP